MNWIYLSPHLDDAAFSCGGLLWEQGEAGERTAIWTVCAGDPPPGALSRFAQALQGRWQTGGQAAAQRRAEDVSACKLLRTAYRHLPIPDCIYRRHPRSDLPLYDSEEALFDRLHPVEDGLVEKLKDWLGHHLPANANLVCPLAIGGHVDHQLVRAAAQALGRPLWYYADFPYLLQASTGYPAQDSGMARHLFPVTPPGLRVWKAAIAAYTSQISTFWSDLAAMQAVLDEYHIWSGGGVVLWRSEYNPK